jgi:folate-dependent phosphoribosylglycinamide formyltransferase PurN
MGLKVIILTNTISPYVKLLNEKLKGISEIDVEIAKSKMTILEISSFIQKQIKHIGLASFLFQIAWRINVNRKIKKKVQKLHEPSFKILPSLNSKDIVSQILLLETDLIILGQVGIIPNNILENLTVKMLNAHPAILPYYRGYADPLSALVKNDFLNIGATLHEVSEVIDGGEIIDINRIDIQNYPKMRDLVVQSRLECINLYLCYIRNHINTEKDTNPLAKSEYNKEIYRIHRILNLREFVKAYINFINRKKIYHNVLDKK